MQVTLLGLGLIGGSIARALRARPVDTMPALRIVAWSPSGRGPASAAAEGVVDLAAGSPAEAVAGADLVVLAAPPLRCLDLLEDLTPIVDPGTIVTDVASTKRAVVDRAAARGLRFVGGHPMAGREASGYGASRVDLFVGRPWVVVPAGDPAAEERVAWLARTCGADVVRLDAAAHDDAVAAISHLPLVVSAALVEAIAGGGGTSAPAGWRIAEALAASGWRDMTRLARGEPSMGAGIAATNAEAIAARIRDLRAVLALWLDELEQPGGPDPDRLMARLAAARARLETGRTSPAEPDG